MFRIPVAHRWLGINRGFIELPILFQRAQALEFLPSHHADPVDRMLLAQAKVERLVIVTHDRHFEPYGQAILWT